MSIEAPNARWQLVSSGAPTAVVATLLIALIASWLASRALYLPHVDDLFIAAWAKAEADGASMPVHALSRFLVSPEYFQFSPKGHILALAVMFGVFTDPIDAVLALRVAVFVMAAAIVAYRCREMPIVSIFFPLLLGITMLHTGLRWEGSALVLLLGGIMLLWETEPGSGLGTFARRTLAKTLIVLAPLAAPSALAYGAGILLVADLRQLSWRNLPALALEGAIALLVGILALGAMIGFDFHEFLRVYGAAGEGNVLLNFAPMRVFNGAGLLAVAFVLRHRAPRTSWLTAAIGLGALISVYLHNKISISIPMSSLALLLIADEAVKDRRRALWLTAGTIALALYVNQIQFALLSRAEPAAAAEVHAFAERARSEGRTLLVDEIAGIHGLGLDLQQAYAWTWSLQHPNSRPGSIEAIKDGESWIISTYTIHGWLRSSGVAGFPVRAPAEASALRGLPCLLGRNSCRLPKTRWSYYLVERRNGEISMQIAPGGRNVLYHPESTPDARRGTR